MDAVRLLGEQSNPTVEALDRLAGGVILAVSAAGAPSALGLLEAKSEFAQLSQELVRGLSDRIRGLDRFTRSERLQAAHAVLVISAYFEALETVRLPVNSKSLRFDPVEQVALATGESPESSRLGAVARVLLRSEVPIPSPQLPYELALDEIQAFFTEISARILDFVTNLRDWDALTDEQRQQITERMGKPLVNRATGLYQQFFRRLAAGSPEVAFWANSIDHLATRAAIGELATGLAGVEQAFREMARGREPDARRDALARSYRAALEKPITAAGDLPHGLRIPSLASGYVNPNFRVSPIDEEGRPAEGTWWDDRPLRDDLQNFLVGYLTMSDATQAPLVILGHPGAGKSLITQMLAARLPPSDFLTVRVVLRSVAAESDLQTQIETAIRAATGEAIAWPALVRTAGDALPVIILDGFDELLQVSGASQSDYLERIVQFQEREADQGRPAAVILTSRTAVADRVRYPLGTTALLIEPFDETQVSRWLSVWNATNADYYRAHNLKPTPVEAFAAHEDLSRQPLLLLMLALYDADSNALQSGNSQLSQSELYERLLVRFAEREVMKTGGNYDTQQIADQIELELTQLAIVAYGMFNRNRQWISEEDLDSDLSVMLPVNDESKERSLRARLSAGQLIVGRFFFVHQAQAIQDGTTRRTYEFLHATFGEYLMARLAVRELGGMAAVAEAASMRGYRNAPPTDDFLYPLLACVPLSVRSSILTFLIESIPAQLTGSHQRRVRELLTQLHHRALNPRLDSAYANYAPLPQAATVRHASYTANLVLLTTSLVGELTAQRLFPSAGDPVDSWRRHALLWRSQLSEDGWESMVNTLEIERIWTDDRPDLRITIAKQTPVPALLDPYWIYNMPSGHSHRGHYAWQHHDDDSILRQSQFLTSPSDDLLIHALEPLSADFSPAIATFAGYWTDRSVSAAHALIKIWTLSSQRANPELLASAYHDALAIGTHAFAPWLSITQDRYLFLILRQLAADAHRLPMRVLDAELGVMIERAPDSRAWVIEAFKEQRVADLLPACVTNNREVAPS